MFYVCFIPHVCDLPIPCQCCLSYHIWNLSIRHRLRLVWCQGCIPYFTHVKRSPSRNLPGDKSHVIISNLKHYWKKSPLQQQLIPQAFSKAAEEDNHEYLFAESRACPGFTIRKISGCINSPCDYTKLSYINDTSTQLLKSFPDWINLSD